MITIVALVVCACAIYTHSQMLYYSGVILVIWSFAASDAERERQ